MIHASSAWQSAFPGAHCGFLVMRNVSNPHQHPALETLKRALESDLRQHFAGADRRTLDAYGVLPAYAAYYKQFGKTYPVRAQLESVIFKEKTLPSVAALVEAMFMAEIKNLLLTAGHDLDTLQLPVTINVADGSERYLLLRGQAQTLKSGDMCMTDRAGIISSILYGPDARTQITPQTRNVLFAVYAPAGIETRVILAHLADMRDYAWVVEPNATVELIDTIGAF